MRALALLMLVAAPVLPAEAPAEFTFSRSITTPARGPEGNKTTYSLDGNVLSRVRKSWGLDPVLVSAHRTPELMFDFAKSAVRKTETTDTKKVTLTAGQLDELRAAVAAASGVVEVRVPSPTSMRMHLSELSLSIRVPKGGRRELVVQAILDGRGVPHGPGDLPLKPDPSDTKATSHPSVKAYAAMGALDGALQRLMGDRAFPDGNSL